MRSEGTVPASKRANARTHNARRNTQYAQRNTKHEVFNVACGKDQSVLDLVDTLNKIMGKDIKPVFTPPRPGDVFRTLADISKIESMLGYKPRVGFEEGLRRTVESFAVKS